MRWNWYRISIWGFVCVFLVSMVVIPSVEWILEEMYPPESGKPIEDLTFAQIVRMRSIEAIIAFIFFAYGGAIGSFLNVVVYRMPRGESVIFKPSSCPTCGSRIKGKDNIPIFGWLLLDGKCRACDMPISIRYPIVETIAAVIFLGLYFTELISGGDNLPVRRPNIYRGVVWIIFYTKWDLVLIYLFHCLAISSLLTWALIDYDRYRINKNELKVKDYKPLQIPLKMIFGVVLLLCLSIYLFPLIIKSGIRPDLIPVPWQIDFWFGVTLSEPLSTLGTALTGGVIGGVLGYLASLAIRISVSIPGTESKFTTESNLDSGETNAAEPLVEKQSRHLFWLSSHTVSAGLIVGLTLGWQAVIGVWLIAFALRPVIFLLAKCLRINELPMTAVLLIAFLVQLLGWRWSTATWWPSFSATPLTWGLTAASLGILWAINHALSKNNRLKLQPERKPKPVEILDSNKPIDLTPYGDDPQVQPEGAIEAVPDEPLDQPENDQIQQPDTDDAR